MERVLKVLNELERRGLMKRYAIGGGMATMFYMEPLLTYDVDVLVFLPETPGRLLTLSPIYDALRKRGYRTQHEHMMIEGIPVQFIPAYNELVTEAVREAREVTYKRIATRVLKAEHLLAIMLQTSRPKDLARMTQLLEEGEINTADFSKILDRHGLRQQWHRFRKRFYGFSGA